MATPYLDSLLADSPFILWRLNESSGSVADDLGSAGQDGEHDGSPSLGQAPLSVDDGAGSVLYNGTTQLTSTVNLGSGQQASSPISLGGRILTTSSAPEICAVAVARANTKHHILLGVDEGKPWVEVNNTSAIKTLVGSTDINDGLAHDIAVVVTFAGTPTVELYVDGTLIESDTHSISYPFGLGSNVRFACGARPGGTEIGHYFPGRVEAARYYRSALTGTRIMDHALAAVAASVRRSITLIM